MKTFDKVEIRVAEVKEVSKVEGSDKLLQFRLDAGDGEDRQNPLRNCKILSKRTKNWSAIKVQNRCQSQNHRKNDEEICQPRDESYQ